MHLGFQVVALPDSEYSATMVFFLCVCVCAQADTLECRVRNCIMDIKNLLRVPFLLVSLASAHIISMKVSTAKPLIMLVCWSTTEFLCLFRREKNAC